MLVYLSGPLSSNGSYTMQANADLALDVYYDLIQAGVNCLCPHLGCTDIRAQVIPYERWMDYDFALIDACTHILMLPRWKDSPGARRELTYAKEKGKIVLYDTSTLLV